MKIMVTGDRGYIGAVLVPMLKQKNYDVVGFDSGYFTENLLEEFNDLYPKITKDLRDLQIELHLLYGPIQQDELSLHN